MPKPGRKRGAAAAKVVPESPPPAKRGRKASKKEPEAVVTTPSKKKTLGVSKKQSVPAQRVSPRRTATNNTAQEIPPSKVKKGGRTRGHAEIPDLQDGQNLDTEDYKKPPKLTVKQVKAGIKEIILESRAADKALAGGEEAGEEAGEGTAEVAYEQQDDDGKGDSEDELSDTENIANHSQVTMDGDGEYLDGGQVAEDDESVEDEDDNDVSTLRMVPTTVDYSDPTKSHEDWWTEDTTRETALCDLWRENESLYVFNHPDHRITSKRNVILRRMATVLEVPRKY